MEIGRLVGTMRYAQMRSGKLVFDCSQNAPRRAFGPTYRSKSGAYCQLARRQHESMNCKVDFYNTQLKTVGRSGRIT
jgi:hypothetical protein